MAVERQLASLAISKKAQQIIKHEAQKSGRKMYVEAELMVKESYDARNAARAEEAKKK
jgi:hypothetical protein